MFSLIHNILRYVPRFIPAVFIIGVVLLIAPSGAALSGVGGKEVFSTDFSDAVQWDTNSDERFFHDIQSGRYQYILEGGTGGYSSVSLPEEISGGFILEFDITPVHTDEAGTHRFGIGSEKKDSMKGPLLMVELADKKDGRLFYLKTVSKENVLNIVGSSPSTGSSDLTVRYEDNSTYHIRLTYYEEDYHASITVHEAGSAKVLFSSIAPVAGKMEGLTHLFITALGDGVPGPKAVGYIDNISLILPDTPALKGSSDQGLEEISEVDKDDEPMAHPTLVESSLDESEPTMPVSPTVYQTVPPLPSPPSQSPVPTQASGGPSLLVFPAILGAGFIWRQKTGRS
jgi:hypothetical protein